MDLPLSFISLTDLELAALINCASHRLVVIAPGLSLSVAEALVQKWRDLGTDAVRVVLDSDPEVCRLGLGDLRALELLQETAQRMGTHVLQQQGLRVGFIITDEATTVFAPTPLLIEAGGRAGERRNAIRLDAPTAGVEESTMASDLGDLNLIATPLQDTDVKQTCEDLRVNPPAKFDLARKVRVFNSRIEFVEFEVRGAALSRKTIPIPSDLMGFAKEPRAQKLLRSSFQLVEKNTELSGERIHQLRNFIAKTFLVILPNYGTVIERARKEEFEAAVWILKRYIRRFEKLQKKCLQETIRDKCELVISALTPGVVASPPKRWKRRLGENPSKHDLAEALRVEVEALFGSAEALLGDMQVNVIFKGVTYELLSDPEFVHVAQRKIKSLHNLHEECDAAAGSREIEQVSHLDPAAAARK